MRVQQRLASGITIRQDFRTSVRFPIFETGYEEWPYATEGGTLFLVTFRGRVFGLTCRHVLGSFDWQQLRVTEAKYGRMFAPIRGLVYPSAPTGAAIDTDILDIAVVEFAPEIGPNFFPDPPYILDSNTCGSAGDGDVLYAHGALKDKSDLSAMRSARSSAFSNSPIRARLPPIPFFGERLLDLTTLSSPRSRGSAVARCSTRHRTSSSGWSCEGRWMVRRARSGTSTCSTF
jgi:hypothetical protein